MLLDQAQARLFVAEDNSDQVDVVDTATNKIIDSIPTAGPSGIIANLKEYHGVIPNSLALSPDGKSLYVTNGGMNSVAIVGLDHKHGAVTGLVPTGFYPNAAEASNDGRLLYVVNGKSPTGSDPKYFPKNSALENASNQYIDRLRATRLFGTPLSRWVFRSATTECFAISPGIPPRLTPR